VTTTPAARCLRPLRRAATLAALALLVCAPTVVGRAGAAREAKLPADSGVFHIRLGGVEIATDTFSTDGTGGSTSRVTDVRAADRRSALITVHAAAGGMIGFETSALSGSFRLAITPSGTLFSQTPPGGPAGPPRRIDSPANLFPFSSLAPEQLGLLLAAYDRRAGGVQTFSVVTTNDVGARGAQFGLAALSAAGSCVRTVRGRPELLLRYDAAVPTATASVDAEIVTDADGRPLLYRVPARALATVREGCEDAFASELTGAAAPSDYAVTVERGVRVPMRDGVTLAADVFRPDAPGRFPVVLQRTPDGRRYAFEAAAFARRGFIYVAQDVRGRYDSGGTWRPYLDEGPDGADTLEWCAHQRWSNGRIGMTGGGYQAFTQWAAACQGNAHLKCIVPVGAPSDPPVAGPYRSGVLALYDDLAWARRTGVRISRPFAPPPSPESLLAIPVSELDRRIYGYPLEAFQALIAHPAGDPAWRAAVPTERIRAVPDLPALHVCGWLDPNLAGTLRNYSAMTDSGHKNQRLICGPWPATPGVGPWSGGADAGAESAFDLMEIELAWFDRWLRQPAGPAAHEPAARIFMRGEERWRDFDAWPPRAGRSARWYLRSGAALDAAAPAEPETPDTFAYDPAAPFQPAWLQPGPISGTRAYPGATADSLDYDSAPLEADVTIAGPVVVRLAAGSSAPTADWFAALLDVGPGGDATLIAHGISTARYRRSVRSPAAMKPGEAVPVTIDLAAAGCVFRKGHRLRLVVASSCFPLYARCLNTGEERLTATQTAIAYETVYHDPGRQSFVELPVPRK